MTWRGMMIAGMLVLLSFSATVASAQVPGSRDPFARIGVAVPSKVEAKPAVKPQRRAWHPQRVVPAVAPIQYNDVPFPVWLQEFQIEARRKGIPQPVLDDAFRNVTPNDDVVRLDRKQPEDKISWTEYRTGALNPIRINKGQALMVENAELLKQISAHYRVPANIIVALWGSETSYGVNKGNFSLIQSLTTLAYEGRRADFFRQELLNALQIARDERVVGAALTGSWAGAMGHCQFMPSSYLKYAVDWDRDGHRDIWNSEADALASIANYLHQSGWDDSVGWAIPVNLPADFPVLEADLYKAQPLQYWRNKGVATVEGKQLPGNPRQKGYIMFPGTPLEEAYLVTDNYHVLLKWNRSRYFASSVGLLADALVQ